MVFISFLCPAALADASQTQARDERFSQSPASVRSAVAPVAQGVDNTGGSTRFQGLPYGSGYEARKVEALNGRR
ncbi:MAG: hypothetical protein B7X62_12725 [Burkholderiales bacterium 39-55-53]|jgi:hypothetical protein|nr:MAG: hypothetical protein B7X62_12725 [Burkholderiales bacterium 39-55-53]